MFITLEGPDGAGKTTQARLLAKRLRADGADVVAVREPGGTDLGNAIRRVLIGRRWASIDPRAETLLFAACRAQLVAEVIRPALARGAIVVADRFADSTRAYQGAGRGLPEAELESVIAFATGGLTPDLTVLLDVPVEVSRARMVPPSARAPGAPPAAKGDHQWNRFEDEPVAFHERVRAAYLKLAQREPERWMVLDASGSVQAVHAAIWEAVCRVRGVATASGDARPRGVLPGSPQPE